MSATLSLKRSISKVGSALLPLVNRIGETLLRDGAFISLEEAILIDKGRKKTGLHDYGDESFRLPLAVLLESFEKDADLNIVGRICVHSEIVRMLSNRLRMIEDCRRHPEISKEQIRRPLFITGLPRSGTTFLHAVLAQDPQCRAPQVWEAMYPSPPPETSSYSSDPRIRTMERRLGWLDVLMPEFGKFHLIDARYPQECLAITDHAFMSYVFESMYQVSSYRLWHDRQDKRPAYEFHRRFLQHLQWRCPGTHWVLKSPSHLMAMEALFFVYPDADIVVTHRDPLKVLPSCSSFARVLRRPFTNRLNNDALHSDVNLRWQASASSLIRFRKENRDLGKRFYDVMYPDLMRDPINVVRAIYRHFERELTPHAEGAMKLLVKANPKNKNGEHQYSLEQFGFDGEAERDRFQFYTEHYGILPEP